MYVYVNTYVCMYVYMYVCIPVYSGMGNIFLLLFFFGLGL